MSTTEAAAKAGRSFCAAASAALVRIGARPGLRVQAHLNEAGRKSRVPPCGRLRQAVVSFALSNQWERQQKAREEKLQAIKEQVEEGSLVIRKMTDEERKANP